MLWYNNPEAVKVLRQTSCGWDEVVARRGMLRLIRTSQGH
jgi:hypothetical protein